MLPLLTLPALLTFPDSDECDEHNVWNPMLNLFCQEYVGEPTESYLDEAVLGRIALSCHFALDLLCESNAEARYRGIIALLEYLFWPSCVTVTSQTF